MQNQLRRRVRFGVVGYLNAWPLTRFLPRSAGLTLSACAPNEVASGLRAGAFDVGLVPAIELLRQPGLEVVPGAAIGAFGRVGSVLALLRTAPALVRDLVVDPASRTSQVLAALILARAHGANVRWREAEPWASWKAGEGDAVLVIGDAALRREVQEAPSLDLGEAWASRTQLPFVFAVFAARPGVLHERPDLPGIIAEAARRGREAIPEFAAEAGSSGLGLTRDLTVYLQERIRYALGPLEMAGLTRFLDEAQTLRFEEMQRDARPEVHSRKS